MELTQAYLKELFFYDGENLIWKVGRSNYRKAGSIAGGINKIGYRRISVDCNSYLAHRLIWLYHYGAFPTQCIDHINGDRKDNRLKNLREATRQQNQINRCNQSNNISGIVGVHFNKRTMKWISQITLGRKTIHIGSFENIEDASDARLIAEKKYFGEWSPRTCRKAPK